MPYPIAYEPVQVASQPCIIWNLAFSKNLLVTPKADNLHGRKASLKRVNLHFIEVIPGNN